MKTNITCRAVIATALLSVTFPAHADWCSGTWVPFVEMKLSDRVNKATDALDSLQKDLQEAATRMKLDVEANRTRLMQKIQLEKQRLYDDTSQLCRNGRDAPYPLQYGAVSLQDVEQFRAQLRLNLGLYQAQHKVEQTLQQRIAEQQALATAMSAKYNELAVLEQQARPLQGMGGTVPEAERFVQTACIAAKAGDELLETAPTETLEELLGEVLLKEQQPGTEADVSNLLADCNSLPAPVTADSPAKPSGWFSRLFSGGGG